MSGDFHATKNFSLKSTGENISPTEKEFLKRPCDTREFSPGRTPLMDGKRETLQQEENSAVRTPYDDSTNGCLNKILRGVLQESFDRGK